MAVDGSEAETPLLDVDGVEGVVDYKKRPVSRSKSGGWRSAGVLMGVEMAERFASCGITSNMITYLTGPLGLSTATAAENINVWTGVSMLLPLLGAIIADSFVGRYRMIVGASVLYVVGLGLLTLSALLPTLGYSDCESATSIGPCLPPHFQVVFFFLSLYLVAIAQGGRKPCVQAFGADQFDTQDPQERKAKSSFFNWWYLCCYLATSLSFLILNYIQDNVSWGLGFGIPCIVMAFALMLFLLGTTTYRFSITTSDEENEFAKIGRVFVRAARNWRSAPSAVDIEEESRGILPQQRSDQFHFLDKALLCPKNSKEDAKVCGINDIEEAKAILRLFPIWMTCLVYAIAFAQSDTFFTKQGATMDRYVAAGFTIPSASLHIMTLLSIVIFLPTYDRVFVPIARGITHKPSGITTLQRVGCGIFLSVISMVIAALVEGKRLETALEYGLIDKPEATVPMSFWWLVPQYMLVGIADVFTFGLLEFFYDQMPGKLKSVGVSLYLSFFGMGNILSSILISLVESITGKDGQDSWFSDNLNRAHLDYFYWLLAGLNAVAMLAFLHVSKSYIYNRGSTV